MDISVLVAGDPAAFDSLLEMLMSSDNNNRQVSERAFEELKAHPDACVLNLVRSLRQSQQLQSKSLCAVLLRKVLTRDEPSLWPAINDNTKNTVKAELLACIKEEPNRNITKKVCDTVSELGAILVEENKWPELLPFMFSCVQSGQDNMMESALFIFDMLARYVIDQLVQYLGTLHSVLQACLTHNNMDVRMAAFKATTTFIQAIENPTDRDQFQSMVPLLLQTIAAALNAEDEVAAQDAVAGFIEVAEEHPRFLRKQLPDVLQAMLSIANAEGLDEATRRLAAEFLVTLCEAREKAPGMMRKVPEFLAQLFNCVISFLFDCEDDPEWHTAEDETHEDEGHSELFDFGQECLDRLALALGGKTLVPLAGQLLPQLLADGDWKKRHAALICLAQTAEGCAKVMAEQTAPLVQLCLQGAQDPNAKVRWAACQALGQLCTDLAPEIQENEHDKILPALLALMDDFANPRVQAHACAATVNFAEAPDQDVIAPYLDTLISKLLTLLQQANKRNVQESALTALASVADCAKEYFDKYYDTCMPVLRHILEHARDKTHQMLRAKALECISLVGIAVGKERFAKDVVEIMAYMQQVQAAGLDDDDPLASYMMQAGARFCSTLGPDFIPFLPIVMPNLLATAKLQPDVVVKRVGESDDEEEADDADGDMETFYVGDKKVSLHTSVLEEKASACSMLCCYAYELKEGFFPYVNEVTQIMVPQLKFYFNEEVRGSSAQTLPELLRSAILAAQKGMGSDEAFVRNMVAFMWPALIEAIKKEADLEVLNTFLVTVEEIVDVVEGPKFLPIDQLVPLFEAFQTVLTEYEDRRKDRMARMNSEDFDAEENEALEDEHEVESELLDVLGTACSTILRKYGDSVMPLIETLMPAMGRLLDKGRFSEERRIALCLMDDIIQHSATGSAKYAAQVMPMLIAGCADKDAGIKQCCVFGLGQAAEHRGDVFRQYATSAVPAILSVVNAPDGRNEETAMATENGIGALGKVLEFQPDCLDPSAGALFVNSLPLTEDATEAKVVHDQLLRMIQKSDPRILGDNNAHLPKLVQIMVQVLAKGTTLVEEGSARNMAMLLQQMQAALPADVFQGFIGQLKPKQQQVLQAVLSGQVIASP